MVLFMIFTTQKEYEKISKRCREFTVALLDECRTSNEVELLLKKEPNGQVPRLKEAIDKEIKEVI